MKMIVSSVIVAIGLIATPAWPMPRKRSPRAAAVSTVTTSDTKKMGPAFKEIAAKYKGKADAAATLETKLAGAKGHPAVKTSADDNKALVKWILSM